MGFIEDFGECFTVTVSWEPLLSQDVYGKPTYDAGVNFKARVVRENKLVRNKEGQEVMSTAQCWLEGNPEVSPEDQITLEDATTPAILAIERFQDDIGPSHTKVFFL